MYSLLRLPDEVTDIWNLAQPLALDGVGQYAAPNINDPYISELVGLFRRTDPNASISYIFTAGWTSTQVSQPITRHSRWSPLPPTSVHTGRPSGDGGGAKA